MARGQRKTIEEKIIAKEEMIAALELRIKKEKEELQQMQEEKRQKELAVLDELMAENGLDIESVKNLILEKVG